MPTPTNIIKTVAALMNDAAQTQYTNANCLPYLNLSLNILQEIFELNDIPVTHKTSAAIIVKAGISRVGFDTTPSLPSDLIEIEQLWETTSGLDQWIPMTKRDFLPHYLQNNVLIAQFLIWAWKDSRIEVIPALADNDIKMDYIGSIFKTPIDIANVDVNIPAVNIQTFLEFQTASLCATFIAENPTRAAALSMEAGPALSRSLGIPIKGMQSVVTRRRPFRSAWKRRGANY